MKHYEVIPDADGRRGRWQVRHKASGLMLTPNTSNFARPVRKTDAEHIAKVCEQAAPTDDPKEAGRLLLAQDFPGRFMRWINPRYQAHSVTRAFAGVAALRK